MVAYGAALGVACHGGVGLAIALWPKLRWLFVLILLAFTILSLIYLVWVRIWTLALSRPLKIAVTEFLLRNISFRKERPLLPANEVSNRTILMSLVALPFRTVGGAPAECIFLNFET